MIETSGAVFDVGGVLLERPFKVRRLGHIGFNCNRIGETLTFYRDLLGFAVSDRADFASRAADARDLDGAGDTNGYFMRYGSDHHSMVLFNKKVTEAVGMAASPNPEVWINQLSWQVGSLEELVRADDWLSTQGAQIKRRGRDWPGSNWHLFFNDPDGHNNELFYGMEQIGWQRKAKPTALESDIRARNRPAVPRASEQDELRAAVERGIDFTSPPDVWDALPRDYDVEGVMLPRPFRVTRLGPVGLFVRDVSAAAEAYRQRLGLRVTEEAECRGHRCIFLRAGTEHHSLLLAPLALRAELGMRPDSTTMTIGLQVSSYRQLRAARAFFQERGAELVALPPELHTGIDYAYAVRDPEGHFVMLHFGMDQLGWQGIPRPRAQRPAALSDWPESVAGDARLFDGETFMGPLG